MVLMAKVEIDAEGILTQMEKVIKAKRQLEDEMNKLDSLLYHVTIKEKGDSEESPIT